MASETQIITREELRAKLARGERLALVEALPASYFEQAHLPGAVNLPHDQVELLAPTLLPDPQVETVVYCANAACANSRIAAERLRRLGYTRVWEYTAGKQDWVEAGLPTESGPAEARPLELAAAH